MPIAEGARDLLARPCLESTMPPDSLDFFGFDSQDALSPGESLSLMPEDALNVCKGHQDL